MKIEKFGTITITKVGGKPHIEITDFHINGEKWTDNSRISFMVLVIKYCIKVLTKELKKLTKK